MLERFTIIDEAKVVDVEASVADAAVRLPAASVEKALGWKLQAEGLCKDGVCLRSAGHDGLVTDSGVDLEQLAALLDRPLALDHESAAAALGTSADARTQTLATLEAPEFTLPDIDGKLHSLNDYRGKKVLLVAFASW